MRHPSFLVLNVLIVLLFISSGCETAPSKEELLHGTWQITHLDGKEVETKEGLQFAPNKQYFLVDSQGKSVPRLIEKTWQIKADSLILVDHNWEPDFIEKHGTLVYLIEELKDDYLRLKLVNQLAPTTIEYKK